MRPVVRRDVGPLRVAVVPVPELRSVASLLALESGQWFEPSGRPGIARLTAQSLLRGTSRRDAAAWSAALDDLGAAARMDVGSHAAVLSGQCLGDDLASYLKLIAEAVLHPALQPAEIDFVRAQTIAALEEAARDTRAVAEDAWRGLAYPDRHPFRARPLGDDAVVRSADADELRAYHRGAMLAGRPVLAIAGGVDAERAFSAVEEAFGEWPATAADRPVVPQAAISAMQRRAVVVPDKTQADVVLGWLGIPRRDERFVPARVTNMVYAADTFASRAGYVIRDEMGLAYYVHSTLAGTMGQGPWVLRMGVNPANAERAIATAIAELRKIVEGQIRDEDLDLARDKLVGELQVALESPGGVAQMVLEAELFGLGEDHFDRYPGELRAVTKDQVRETARALLPPDRYALAIAGPPLP